MIRQTHNLMRNQYFDSYAMNIISATSPCIMVAYDGDGEGSMMSFTITLISRYFMAMNKSIVC